MKRGDWPKTIEKKIEIYQPEELKPFFAACTPEERLIFQVFLLAGFREREVATFVWPDIHWKEGKLAVSAKPELGFTPKSYEERSVPVPMSLIETLRERKNRSSSRLVFPTLPHPTRPEYGQGQSGRAFIGTMQGNRVPCRTELRTLRVGGPIERPGRPGQTG